MATAGHEPPGDSDGGESDETAAQGDGGESGTTDEDYRWRGLSTLFTLVYGLGFPFAAFAFRALGIRYPPGTLMGVLTLAWLGVVVYIIGPENVKAAKSLKG